MFFEYPLILVSASAAFSCIGHLQVCLVLFQVVAICATDLHVQQALPANGLCANHLHFVCSLVNVPRVRLPVGHRHLRIAARGCRKGHSIRLHRCEYVAIQLIARRLLECLE